MGQLHLKGFSPVCSFRWLFRAHFSVKLRSHRWQGNFLGREGERDRVKEAHCPPGSMGTAGARGGGRGLWSRAVAGSVMSV